MEYTPTSMARRINLLRYAQYSVGNLRQTLIALDVEDSHDRMMFEENIQSLHSIEETIYNAQQELKRLYVVDYISGQNGKWYYSCPLTIDRMNRTIDQITFTHGVILGVEKTTDMSDTGGEIVI